MLHLTMLDDVGPTCWLRLSRPDCPTVSLHIVNDCVETKDYDIHNVN